MRRIEIKSPETKGKPLLFHCVRSRNDKELTGEIGGREKEKAGQRENKIFPWLPAFQCLWTARPVYPKTFHRGSWVPQDISCAKMGHEHKVSDCLCVFMDSNSLHAHSTSQAAGLPPTPLEHNSGLSGNPLLHLLAPLNLGRNLQQSLLDSHSIPFRKRKTI